MFHKRFSASPSVKALAVLSVLLLASASQAKTPLPKNRPPGDQEIEQFEIATLAEQCDQFGFDLYAKLAAEAKGNLFFSPSTIHSVMTMAYTGAGGDTAEQLKKALHLTYPKDKIAARYRTLISTLAVAPRIVDRSAVYQLTFANALWFQHGLALKADFSHMAGLTFGANPRDVDFSKPTEAAKTINDWVADATGKRITDLVPPDALDAQTQVVLASAIHLKARWEDQFLKEATKPAPFQTADGKTVQPDTMARTGPYDYYDTNDMQILSVPYRRDVLTMFVILPKKAGGLAAIEQKFPVEKLLLAADPPDPNFVRFRQTEISLSLPKFKIATNFQLNDPLKSMGISNAFAADKADFSGITDAAKIALSKVLQKTYVTVDENGTEAAAATDAAMAAADRQTPTVFKADRPFLFVIYHRPTGTILFMGRVANPLE